MKDQMMVLVALLPFFSEGGEKDVTVLFTSVNEHRLRTDYHRPAHLAAFL